MGSKSSSRSNQQTENSQLTTTDNRVDNSTHYEDNSTSQTTIDSSYSDSSVTTNNSSADYTDSSVTTNNSSADYTDNSSYDLDSSYKDSSVNTDNSSYSSSADYTDNSSYSSDSSYKDNSTTTYIDAGSVQAGRDVSISAINAVAQSSAQLNDTYKTFAFQTEQATDSALSVASNVANTNGGNSGVTSPESMKTIGYSLVALAIVAAIAKKVA